METFGNGWRRATPRPSVRWSMTTAKVKAYAKINLTLDIVGRENGFHMLDSLVTSIDLYDLVTVKKRKDKQVFVRMRGLDSENIPETNNAKRAGEAFVNAFQTQGADITIDRNIPTLAGLGGSSADAAGVLVALQKLYGVKEDLKPLADLLGSDTGYMLTGGFCRLTGRGERVKKLAVAPSLFALLICPLTGVSTAECYRKFDETNKSHHSTEACLRWLAQGEKDGDMPLSNDLYEPAKSLNPDVEKALLEARSFSPLGVNMTGSGSAVYALFDTRELRDWAYSRYQGKFRLIKAETIKR